MNICSHKESTQLLVSAYGRRPIIINRLQIFLTAGLFLMKVWFSGLDALFCYSMWPTLSWIKHLVNDISVWVKIYIQYVVNYQLKYRESAHQVLPNDSHFQNGKKLVHLPECTINTCELPEMSSCLFCSHYKWRTRAYFIMPQYVFNSYNEDAQETNQMTPEGY